MYIHANIFTYIRAHSLSLTHAHTHPGGERKGRYPDIDAERV